MRPMITGVVGGVLTAIVASAAVAQPYGDPACAQWAQQMVQYQQAQANSGAVGSTLMGAALGAGIGGAVGGGRGAAIGAGAGALTGGAAGSANANATAANAPGIYASYYQQCMASRYPSAAPAPGYGPQPGYAPAYAPPGYSPYPPR